MKKLDGLSLVTVATVAKETGESPIPLSI